MIVNRETGGREEKLEIRREKLEAAPLLGIFVKGNKKADFCFFFIFSLTGRCENGYTVD